MGDLAQLSVAARNARTGSLMQLLAAGLQWIGVILQR